MSRKIAMARRCQLITGSFEGNLIPCPCEGSKDCHLTKEEREEYGNNPVIIETAQAQREAYDAIQKREAEEVSVCEEAQDCEEVC